jgi:Flp pilus assembly protein TadG
MWRGCWRPLQRAITRLERRRLRDLARDQSGNILVEAALVFPILIGLFLGVSEFSEGFTVSRRLAAAAHTAADLVARYQTVTADDLNGVKAMIDETVKPFSVANLGLVITSVVADKDNATTVAWSQALGTGASAHSPGAAITLPAGLTLPNSSVIFAEIKYQFRSSLSTLIMGSVPLQAEAYQVPRFSAQVVMK